MYEYGAPTGLRLALRRPDTIAAIISQNGNAYEEGLSSFWEPLRAFWKLGGDSMKETRGTTP
jgi:hypothetical protein